MRGSDLKRLIASRKLKRACTHCGKNFVKGNVYYRIREVFAGGYDQHIAAFEHLMCPSCKWRREQREVRYKEFQKKCTHPEEFSDTEWDYIPGECVMEPRYDYCRLCGEKF